MNEVVVIGTVVPKEPMNEVVVIRSGELPQKKNPYNLNEAAAIETVRMQKIVVPKEPMQP